MKHLKMREKFKMIVKNRAETVCNKKGTKKTKCKSFQEN